MNKRYTDDALVLDTVAVLRSAMTKLKEGMMNGPEGDDIILKPAEATIIYRILNEKLGLTA